MAKVAPRCPPRVAVAAVARPPGTSHHGKLQSPGTQDINLLEVEEPRSTLPGRRASGGTSLGFLRIIESKWERKGSRRGARDTWESSKERRAETPVQGAGLSQPRKARASFKLSHYRRCQQAHRKEGRDMLAWRRDPASVLSNQG